MSNPYSNPYQTPRMTNAQMNELCDLMAKKWGTEDNLNWVAACGALSTYVSEADAAWVIYLIKNEHQATGQVSP